MQFIENHFVESYYPTIESTFTKSVAYKGVDYDCDIIDTAGQVRLTALSRNANNFPDPLLQDEYSILNSKHAIGIHGYVLVYSVTSRNSFEMIEIVYDKIIEFCGLNEIPCVIVGSKQDLQSRYVPVRELKRPHDPCSISPKAHSLTEPQTDRCLQQRANHWQRNITPRGWRQVQRRTGMLASHSSSAPLTSKLTPPLAQARSLNYVWPRSRNAPHIAHQSPPQASVSLCDFLFPGIIFRPFAVISPLSLSSLFTTIPRPPRSPPP